MARIEAPDCSMTNTKATLPPNFAANKSALALTYPLMGGQLRFLWRNFIPAKSTSYWATFVVFGWFDLICFVLCFFFSEAICVTQFHIVLDVSLSCVMSCSLCIDQSVGGKYCLPTPGSTKRHFQRYSKSEIFKLLQSAVLWNVWFSLVKICIILHWFPSNFDRFKTERMH